jgi:tetratricopeptide (TPR) repeat protein
MKTKIIAALSIIFILSSLLIFADAERDKKIDECQPLLKEARDLFAKKDVDGAIKKVSEAISKVPDYHNFYNLLAYFYSVKEDFTNQYTASKKMIDLYELAKERDETKNMTDMLYLNYAAASVNYSLVQRNKKDYKAEVKYLKEGLKYYDKYISIGKDKRGLKTAKEQAKIVKEELIPKAEKRLAGKPRQ